MATMMENNNTNEILKATSYAPTNIACIKYWGKRDTSLNLPINSSVSITLDMDDLRTVTTVTASKTFIKDRLWLNGNEENPENNKRVQKVLNEIRVYSRKSNMMAGQIVDCVPESRDIPQENEVMRPRTRSQAHRRHPMT